MSGKKPTEPVTPCARRELVRAWVSLGLMVPGFVGLMAFGEWANEADAPAVASVMTAVMVVLLALFAAAAIGFGVRARRLGARRGLMPATLAGLAVAYYLLLAIVQWIR